MTVVWLVFLVAAAAAAGSMFVVALEKWPVVASISAGVIVALSWEVPHLPALANAAGISIYFVDILSIAALAIGLGRLRALARHLGAGFWPWIGLGLVLMVSLLRGILENPLGTAVNEFRSFLYPYAILTWAMSLTWNRKLSNVLIRRGALVLGWILTFVALLHIRSYGLGSTSEFVDAGTGLEQTTRPLVSGQALMVLLCGMLCLWYWRQQGRKLQLASALVFFGIVIISQQRSVWAVGLASLIIVFLVGRAGTKMLTAVFVLIVAWVASFIANARFIPELFMGLTEAATNSGTYDARVRSWLNLIEQTLIDGPAAVLLGRSVGSGFGRFEGPGRWVEFAPHNWYVTLYLRVGVIGLALVLAFLVFVLSRALRRNANLAAVAVIMAIIVYGWSYSWPWFVCIFLGWAIASGSVEGQQLGTEKNSTAVPATRTPLRALHEKRHLW